MYQLHTCTIQDLCKQNRQKYTYCSIVINNKTRITTEDNKLCYTSCLTKQTNA